MIAPLWRDAVPARFAVIGDPIDHSRSPQMQNAALKKLREPGDFVAIRVPPSEACFALEHLASLGYVGVNVTVPNKSAVIPWLQSVEPFAQRVGAVNTIDLRDRRGTNTDGAGFLATFPKEVRRVLILGAGGSSRALLAALEDAGIVTALWNRSADRAEDLVAELKLSTLVLREAALKDFDVVVNATSASLQGAMPTALDWSTAPSNCLAYELAYPGSSSAFLNSAESAGLATMDGLPLLVEQGALSLEWWLRVSAPRKIMMEAIQ